MTNLKTEDSENPIWQGYGLQQTPASTSAQPPPPFDSNFSSNILTAPYQNRPQKSNYSSLDIPSIRTRPPTGDSNGVHTASVPTLSTNHSYPSLKRAFHSTEDSPYGEVVQDFREELPDTPKPNINQDHKLLSFTALAEKNTIIDQHGRAQRIELAAQIHGMFFLSEMATATGDGLLVQPELTCYRRNLFQISGSATAPRGSLSLITERGERIPILALNVSVSATESVDGHSVKLIVIPWKTPPPNSPEVGPGQEHEPAPIPLQPFEDGSPDSNSEFTSYPIAYRRLQFRIATANNGRRRELQQHFTLHLNVVASLANGAKANVCETSTAPIVVRGRSPRNFQARKEIPLVGSSSRGQAPELHVTTSSMPSSVAVAAKPKVTKPQTMELPRSPFNFDGSNLPASPAMMRQPNYPSWNPSHHPSEQGGAPTTPSYSLAPMGMEYLPVGHSNAESHAPSTTAPVTQSQIRPQYPYPPPTAPSPTGSAPIRFIDGNPRPAKSPRHGAPAELTAGVSYSEYGPRLGAPYNGSSEPLPPREFFQTALPVQQPWTTGPDSGVVYGPTSQASNIQHYEFPNDQQYVKEENSNPPHYNWNTT